MRKLSSWFHDCRTVGERLWSLGYPCVLRCSQVAFYSDGILGGDMIEWVDPNAPVWRRKKKYVEIKEILIPLKKRAWWAERAQILRVHVNNTLRNEFAASQL